MVRHTPGHSARCGAISMYCRPSRLSMPPQLGMSGGRPKPRKLSAASDMITPPTLMLKMMMIGAAIEGFRILLKVTIDPGSRTVV